MLTSFSAIPTYIIRALAHWKLAVHIKADTLPGVHCGTDSPAAQTDVSIVIPGS